MRGALFGWVAASLAIAPAAHALELEGTWYVLVHYQDKESPKPDAWRWEDRVWKFERKGDQLEWTEYPLVIFDDESGRFESARGGSAVRVVGAWEPSAAQLADIKDGLQVNSRGVKTKSLRAQDGGTAWSSSEGAGAASSASVITYSEHWAISGMPDKPVFTRDDAMGGGSTEELSGRTEYRTSEVSADELHGSFDRDGTRIGTFRMIRSGATEGIKTAAKSQQELQRKATLRAFASSEEVRQAVRQNLQSELAQRGTTPTPQELDKLTDQAIAAATRTGSADDATNALAKQATELFYSFAPRGAKHDDTVRYRLPFDPSVPRQLGQGVGGDMGYDLYGNPVSSPQGDPASHLGRFKYGFDWAMPIGTPIVAARDGEVARVIDGGPAPTPGSRTNSVYLKHADGTWSEYVGLDAGIPVQPGQKVHAGDVIAKSGATAWWRGNRGNGQGVHFAVARLDDAGEPETVPIRFDDGSPAGFVPVPGNFYGVSDGKLVKEPPSGSAKSSN